jgi:hypothetical protein
MASIASLVVNLSANTSKFETDMKRASRNQAKRVKEMERQMGQAAKVIGIAFTATAGAMTAMVARTVKTADEMGKMGQRLGASTEALSELSHVANLSGVEFRTLEMGLQRMTRRIGEVAFLGKGEAKVALETLGLSAQKLADLPLDKQFEAIAEELSKVGNVSQRTSLAMKIFDAEGVKLVQLMEDGAGGIQAMRKEAQELGLTIGGELAENSERFNDNITRLKAGFTGASNVMTQAMLPALIDIQEHFLNSGNASIFAAEAGEFLGKSLKVLVAAFVVVKNAAIAFGKVLVGLADLILNAFKAVLAPITGAVSAIVEAFDALKEGDVTKAAQALGKTGQLIGKDWAEAQKKVERAAGFIVDDAIGGLKKGLLEAASVMTATSKASAPLPPKLRKVADGLQNVGNEAEKAAESGEKFTESIESLIDELFPVEALADDFETKLRALEEAARNNTGETERYAEAIRRLKDDYGQAVRAAVGYSEGTTQALEQVVESANLMTTAIDEGVRILQRSFQSMWEGLLDGSMNVFDDIAKGFKSLLANLVHQATTQKIILNIQQGLQPGGSIDTSALFGDLAKFGGVILGSIFGGGGQYANIGAAIGTVAGSALVSALSGTWLALGSIGGPIGIAIVSVLGGLLGGLFDKNRPPVLQVSGFDTSGLSRSDDDSLISTLFGDTFIRSRRIDAAAIGEISQAIEQFDNAFSFLDASQIDSIAQALEGWGRQMEGEAINIEQLLTSRFRVILGTFGDDIQAFVNRGEELAEQMDRLQVAVAAQDILDAAPDLFSGRSLTEFLTVVDAFSESMGGITEGFNEVVRLVNIVGSVLTSLKDFVASDLSLDYAALLSGDVSLTEALAGMNAGLMDAVENFDGSIESLQAIGQMAMVIREGELKLLAQIDGVMQGLNASLDKLKADISALGQPAATGEQIFNRAARLIKTVGAARTPEEIAQIGQEFDALIRSMDPADQLRNQLELLRMIDAFRLAANDNLAAQRQEVFDNAEKTRTMLDGFLTRIGDTLDIIAGSNQEATDWLALIAGGEVAPMDEPIVEESREAWEKDVDVWGRKIENGIKRGFSGVNVQVIVQGQGGLVNE